MTIWCKNVHRLELQKFLNFCAAHSPVRLDIEGNFVSISSPTGEWEAEKIRFFAILVYGHVYIILGSQNKITNSFMILAWDCSFYVCWVKLCWMVNLSYVKAKTTVTTCNDCSTTVYPGKTTNPIKKVKSSTKKTFRLYCIKIIWIISLNYPNVTLAQQSHLDGSTIIAAALYHSRHPDMFVWCIAGFRLYMHRSTWPRLFISIRKGIYRWVNGMTPAWRFIWSF